jgi:hypothetical protein
MNISRAVLYRRIRRQLTESLIFNSKSVTATTLPQLCSSRLTADFLRDGNGEISSCHRF